MALFVRGESLIWVGLPSLDRLLVLPFSQWDNYQIDFVVWYFGMIMCFKSELLSQFYPCRPAQPAKSLFLGKISLCANFQEHNQFLIDLVQT